jgi:hypothetical protein
VAIGGGAIRRIARRRSPRSPGPSANQQFSIVDRGGGNFSIHPRLTGMALDLYRGNAADGTPIVQYPYWGGPNQLWTFQSPGGGGHCPSDTGFEVIFCP